MPEIEFIKLSPENICLKACSAMFFPEHRAPHSLSQPELLSGGVEGQLQRLTIQSL